MQFSELWLRTFADPPLNFIDVHPRAQAQLPHGVTLSTDIVVGVSVAIRKDSQIPIVLYIYFNLMHHYGVQRFIQDAARLPNEAAQIFMELNVWCNFWGGASSIRKIIYAWTVLQDAPAQFAGTSASRTAVRSSSSSKGLVKNADAPAFSAVERTKGSSFPVKMMMRVEGEILPSRDCTSRPLICGI